MSEAKTENKVNKLFVSNLDSKIDVDNLKVALTNLFEQEAPVVAIDVKQHYQNQYYYAFVDFESEEAAIKVKEKFNHHKLYD